MNQPEFLERIRARLREIGDTPVRVAEQAGLPRDSIRSVLRGHDPSVLRADQVCRALGITLTLGVRRVLPEPVDEAGHPRTSSPPAASRERSTVEYFADVVDGPLADLFGRAVEVYGSARSDGERRLVLIMLGDTVTAVGKWILSMEADGTPPIKGVISSELLLDE